MDEITEGQVVSYFQGMSCEGACAHAHVRCAVACVHVRAKSILKSVRDVRGCAMCDHIFSHFWNKIAINCLKTYSSTSNPVLEHPFLL